MPSLKQVNLAMERVDDSFPDSGEPLGWVDYCFFTKRASEAFLTATTGRFPSRQNVFEAMKALNDLDEAKLKSGEPTTVGFHSNGLALSVLFSEATIRTEVGMVA